MLIMHFKKCIRILVFIRAASAADHLNTDPTDVTATHNASFSDGTVVAPAQTVDLSSAAVPKIVSLQNNETVAAPPPRIVSLQDTNSTVTTNNVDPNVAVGAETAAAPAVNALQGAGATLQTAGTPATIMPLQLVGTLLAADGTLDLTALRQHINSISAKLSARVVAVDDLNAPQKRFERRADPPNGRPRQQCTNRGIGRALQVRNARRDPEEEERIPVLRGSWQADVLARRQNPANRTQPQNTTADKKTPPAKPAPAPAPTPTPATQPQRPPPGGEVDGCRGGNFFWSTPMRVGQTMIQAIIDTGSSLTIVDGKLYDAKGATYLKKNFTIDFVDGSAAGGHVFEDTVNVASVNFVNSTVCRDEKGFDLDNAASYGLRGLIGLQRPGFAMKSAGIGGLLDRVRHILRHNLFSLTLTPSKGDLYLGGFDPVVNHKDWVMVPVEDDPEGHWVVKASVNDLVMPKNVVIDSGTSSMLFDHDVAKQILDKMQVTVVTMEKMLLGVFKCDTPPRITIRVGEFSKLLRPETSLLGNLNSTHCYASIVGVPKDTKLSQSAILGGPFFTNTYVGFDFANGRMAFHPQP